MKIAIYSGSFNPVHNGHIAVAQAVLDSGYDEVWLVVSPQNPHKEEEGLWPFEERLKMVEMALTDQAKMKACDCENHLPRPSYTINTLEYLKEAHPQHQFMLLIGGDNLVKFHLWKDYNRILESFGLIVYPRSSGPGNEAGNHPNMHMIKAPLLDVSSTDIRQRLALRQSIHGLVPTEVENYILQKLKYDRSNPVF